MPTLEQTEAFVLHVGTNHSWYKHLPHFPPGCWFLFAPNPNAGCQFAWWESPPRHVHLVRGSYFDHHSRLSTAEYRKRFGVWDYADLHSQIQELSFWPATLPIHFKCRFTSFLRPQPFHGAILEQRVEEDLRAFEDYKERFPKDSDALRYRTLEALARQKDLGVSLWGDSFQTFLREEGRIQQDRLRDTLFRLREEWIEILEHHS
ncbi:MAG: hypothetical protein U1G08_07885 [Verrucomicrobiota bacterium]